jgi:hypothetical protein
MKIRPVGAELFHAAGQTDRHDEANSRFSQFCGRTQKMSLFFKYTPSLHFFARLYNVLPLLRDIFRSAVQLPCNLNQNFRRGLEMAAFADKYNFGEEKIIAPGGGFRCVGWAMKLS